VSSGRLPGKFGLYARCPGQVKALTKEEARLRLVEIYGWFPEEGDTADLQEVRALLEELENKPGQPRKN